MSTGRAVAEVPRSGWLEQMPAGWSEVHLRWLAKLYAGGTPDKSNEAFWTDGTIPWINSGAVNQGLITEASAYISQAGYDGSSARWVPKGALVMALAGQGKTKGTVAEMGIDATCNQSMAAIVPNGVNARYLFYWLTANYRRIRSGASDDLRDGLNLQMLGDIPCPVPSQRSDQERIANFLDQQTARIDALIAEKETLQQRLGEYRLSAITSALSGGLIPYDSLAETGEYWFATVPSHWAFCPLNYRYEVQLGKMLDEKRITGDHLLPYLRNVDVQWGQINTEGLPQMDIHPEEHERYTVRPGDLLVCEGGDVGRAAIWEGTSQVFAFQKALHRVRPRTGNDLPKYLFYLLFDSAKRGRFADREKATIAHLTAEAFRRYRFPFPPREEQEEIVGRLDATMASIDRLLDHVNEHVDRLREYRSSLISAAVTGQLDLSTFKAVA